MKDFNGKTAVVTGAASGIGKALSLAFAARGAKVVLADVEANALEAARADGCRIANRRDDSGTTRGGRGRRLRR